jgi:glycosyltransferase involved in cell wall biosynthesis
MRVTIVNRAMGIYVAGAERFDQEIAIALRNRGIEVEMVVGKRLFSAPNHLLSGIPTHYIATPFLRDISQRVGGRVGNLILRLDQYAFELKCARYLRTRTKSDIIQACSLPHLVGLLERIQVPVVLWFPGIPSIKHLPLIQKAAAVVSNGDAFLNIQSRFRKDVAHVPLGVDRSTFRRRSTNLRQRLGMGEVPTVLYVGRMAPIKNLPMLIQAFALVRKEIVDARLILVGTGPSLEEIKRSVRNTNVGSAVHIAGFVRGEEALVEYYSAADVFALASNYDNDPNVIYEAMSCGLPVVATRVGGVPLQVQDGVNGFLVESGNAQALAQRLIDLLKDARLRARMSETNRKASENLSWDDSAKRLIRLYENILKRQSSVQTKTQGDL